MDRQPPAGVSADGRNQKPQGACLGSPSPPPPAAARIRKALEYVSPEQLIVSSDCGFGRQGCNREIAFFKATAIAQGCNIVRKELGLETTEVPAVNPALQMDIVPKT